ncbi:hypothetical protein ACHAXT_001400 [Thalassiosira profunda]
MAKQKGKGGGKKANRGGGKKQSSGGGGGGGGGKKSRQRKWQQSDDDDDKFRNTLLDQGHAIREMNADGNCLFRSLSDQLYDDAGAKHDVVRHDVCNHLSKNKEEYMHFLLMDDDDEDIVDIDEYVAKMREDGEWGGNVEVVVASRVYRRNIMVFSGEYQNGALSITCEDGERDGDDLMLSYHGNDHYNSVHPVGGRSSQQSSKQFVKAEGASSSAKERKKKGKAPTDDATASTQSDDCSSQPTTDKGRGRPPTRGSNCPCGSGLKYKKCCMAAEKSKKRLAKHLEKRGADGGDADDEKKEDEFIGEFKVLMI